MVAASEYAGALPATAITTVSNVPRALACSPLPLLLLMDALLSVLHDVGVERTGPGPGEDGLGSVTGRNNRREGWIPV